MGIGGFILALGAVIILVLIPWVGVAGVNLDVFFGVAVPYVATIIFFIGLVYRILKWSRSPVPFRIPTTAGQEKSLPWVKTNCIDNPSTTTGVVARMALEILFFRSLFRNTSLDFREGRVYYGSAKWLWGAALVFHYSFLTILLRHLRFFTEPVPFWVQLIEKLDSFVEIGLWPFVWMPALFLSGVVLLMAVTYLFLRRVVLPELRYISLSNDWFPLILIGTVALTGILMRYIFKIDVVGAKQLTLGLVHFSPIVPVDIGAIFYIHIFLVSVLFAYFPFSKLMHAGGVFLSPTRNLVNNSRMVRHINPWNPKVKFHDYEEYEDEFREFMIEAGLPVEKEEAAGEAEAPEEKE